MTQEGHRVIKEWHDLLHNPKGQVELWGRFSVWPLKFAGSLEVVVNYFMTKNGHGALCGQFDSVYDPKGHMVIRGRRAYFMITKDTVTFVVGLT